MTLEQRIDDLAAAWKEHCERTAFSSNPYDYLAHPAYQQLIALGKPAVPLIMERYTNDDVPWEYVLQEITGTNMSEPGAFPSGEEIQRRRLAWWSKEQAAFAATAN